VGYSSLTHLSRMPIDTLKIDRSFVQGMLSEPRLAAIVHSTIQLGRNLDLRVVAEGVDGTGMLRALRDMQCDHAQGFLFSPPVEADRIPPLLGRPLA
jgi:EAL domain-containing protein (putative c-di-GMP-specific phosphodiesterase class I)